MSGNQKHKASKEQPSIAHGPSDLVGLFNWPLHNAAVLMRDENCRASFEMLVNNCDIQIVDNFSGTGNGSVSLKKQFQAFMVATGGACVLSVAS